MTEIKCSKCKEELNCVCATFVTQVNEEENDYYCWKCWAAIQDVEQTKAWDEVSKLRGQIDILKETIKEMMK